MGRKKNVKQVIEFVREHKGIDYAIETARGYSDKAREALKPLPDSQSKLALEVLVDFVIERKN
jgi:octaprenyl-diphosphate synthase